MREVKTKNVRKINWAIPGQTVTHDEFIDAIRKAEEGPFYTIEESEKRFEEWRKKKFPTDKRKK